MSTGEPEVTEILVGGNAWKGRGFFGRIAAALSGAAVHVPWSEVDEIGAVVKLKHSARGVAARSRRRQGGPFRRAIAGSLMRLSELLHRKVVTESGHAVSDMSTTCAPSGAAIGWS